MSDISEPSVAVGSIAAKKRPDHWIRYCVRMKGLCSFAPPDRGASLSEQGELDDLERLEESKPGDVFIVGFASWFGPERREPGSSSRTSVNRMTVESNDGHIVVLIPSDGRDTPRLRITL